MELFANELSVDRQFRERRRFHEALSRLMAMRAVARRFGREVRCHRHFQHLEPIPGVSFRQAVQGLGVDRVRSLLGWLERSGPFWDDERQHPEDEWLEYGDEVVTGTAVGEAAWWTREGQECALLSVPVGVWDVSPIRVIFRLADGSAAPLSAELENWRDPERLEERLRAAAAPISSWLDLEQTARARASSRLVFADDCSAPLRGRPFARGAVDQILRLLDVLDRFAGAFDEQGRRSPDGHRMLQQYFTGDTAWFSDSSATERQEFGKKLAFPHPEDRGRPLFCPWHGKVRHQQLRLHFSWPIRAGEPVYVVYVGRKLTIRA